MNTPQRPPCSCGNPEADWHGDRNGHREYMCASCWQSKQADQMHHAAADRLPFALYVRNDNRAAKLVKLVAVCSTLDMDDPQPAITIMLPEES